MAFELVAVNTHVVPSSSTYPYEYVTVPDGEYWKLTSIFVTVGTDATVGNRVICVAFNNPLGYDADILTWNHNQPASKTTYYRATKGAPDRVISPLYNTINHVQTAFSDLMLGPGFTVTATDIAAVARGSDTIGYALGYEAYRSVQNVQDIRVNGIVEVKTR